MEIKAIVHEVSGIINVTDSFKKRDLVVQYAENPQFVEYVKFEATQDRVSIFDDLTPGDEIEVFFNLRGRPWTNKEGVATYFNSLVAWRVSKTGNGQNIAQQSAEEDYFNKPENDDDLPF